MKLHTQYKNWTYNHITFFPLHRTNAIFYTTTTIHIYRLTYLFYIWQQFQYLYLYTLGGSLVTMAWHVLRLRMEETTSRYEGQLRIYWIRSRGQPTRDGPPAWGLGVGLTKTSCNFLISTGRSFRNVAIYREKWRYSRNSMCGSRNLNILSRILTTIDRVLDQMIEFTDTLYTTPGTTGNYSTITDLHTSQFTVTHGLEFSVFTSRIPSTDL
jgi:hypothetical protein